MQSDQGHHEDGHQQCRPGRGDPADWLTAEELQEDDHAEHDSRGQGRIHQDRGEAIQHHPHRGFPAGDCLTEA